MPLSFACVGVLALACACGGPGLRPDRVRFRNAAVAWRVADEQPVAKPAEEQFLSAYYHFNQLVYRPADRALGVPRYRRASNVNALGEVPSSSWFENRIGRRALSAAQLREGAAGPAGSEPQAPFEIRKLKERNGRYTFIVKDAQGQRYFFKFDRLELPVAESAAHVVANRLLWAAGYHVAQDSIIFVPPQSFFLGKGAVREAALFNREDAPLSQKKLDKILGRLYKGPDGRLRVLASRFLPGRPLGGFPQTGVRADDDNDRVPHERRRELRGMYVFYSWLKSTDMKSDNTIDMWEPVEGSRGVVRHYLIDFGMSLGINGLALGTRGDGYERFFSWSQSLSRAFAFGWPWSWEGIQPPEQPHVGALEVSGYRPDAFTTRVPYLPWESRDRFDTFWAAKILARFQERHVRAAVEAAHYPDPRSGDYVVERLLGRRRVALRHWFALVAPIDEVTIESDGRLCFTDLGVEHGVLDAPSYRAAPYDYQGRAMGPAIALVRDGSRYCATGLARGRVEDGYTVAVIKGARGQRELPAVDVHFATDPRSSRERVVGLRRH